MNQSNDVSSYPDIILHNFFLYDYVKIWFTKRLRPDIVSCANALQEHLLRDKSRQMCKNLSAIIVYIC